MAVIRVTNCDYSLVHRKYILSVDVMYPETDARESRTFFVFAESHQITGAEKAKQFIEQDILAQQEVTPNWSGLSWKSTQV